MARHANFDDAGSASSASSYALRIRSHSRSLLAARRDYAILGCKGAEDALLAMAPEWAPVKDGSSG